MGVYIVYSTNKHRTFRYHYAELQRRCLEKKDVPRKLSHGVRSDAILNLLNRYLYVLIVVVVDGIEVGVVDEFFIGVMGV